MPATKLPRFEWMTLDAIGVAFQTRSKAIRYHGEFSVTRSLDAGNERLNADYLGLFKLQLSLVVWCTGDWWLRALQPRPRRSGGWQFKHELRGTLDGRAAEEFVKSFEGCKMLLQWSPDEQRARLLALWHLTPTPGED